MDAQRPKMSPREQGMYRSLAPAIVYHYHVTMTPSETFNQQQRAHWGGDDGEYWARHQAQLDRMLEPVLQPLLDFAAPKPASTVVDVGCGCGATLLELARRVGPAGQVIGMDLSEAMLAVAARRLEGHANVRLLHGDAAELPLRGVNAELLVSRFGVMFFGDPAAAFRNLRTGLAPGGRVRFVCWRPIKENPWLQIPLHAAYEHVPHLPKQQPEEPGPFSFGDPARVTRILTDAGFTAPEFTPLDLPMEVADGGTLDDGAIRSTEFGPVKRALTEQPEEVRAAVVASIRKALAPYAAASGVKLPGAAWLVAAENPA